MWNSWKFKLLLGWKSGKLWLEMHYLMMENPLNMTFMPHPQNNILVPFKGKFENFWRLLLYSSLKNGRHFPPPFSPKAKSFLAALRSQSFTCREFKLLSVMDLTQLLEGRCKLLFLPVKNIQILCTNMHYVNLLYILFGALVDDKLKFFLTPAGPQKNTCQKIISAHIIDHNTA